MSTNYSKQTTSLVDEALKSGTLTSFRSEFRRETDTLTYEPHFGLVEKPFSLNTDPRFVYGSPSYSATRDSLLAGIRRREGLNVLTGEIGTGKTTLCRAVVRDLGRKTYSAVVPDPFASREDLLKTLLIDFGVSSIQELTTGTMRQASRTELGYLLSEFLDSLPADAFVVVMIDEAQNLSLPLIEETRILADTFGAKGRMQIVFVGQPELHAKLKLPEMRQVDQRVNGYHRLAPLSVEAVAGYIDHRLQVAGRTDDRVLFPQESVDRIHSRTGGVPRLINRVCDRALHIAYERRAEVVNNDILEAALIEIGSTTLSPTWDAIVFAQAPAVPAAVAPAPAAVSVAPVVATPAPVPVAAPVVEAVKPAPPLDADEDFQKQIDQWVAQDLAPSLRKPTPVPVGDSMPAGSVPAKASAKPKASARTFKNAWPRELHAETYLGGLYRTWAKRTAIAAVALVVINVAIAGGASLLPVFEPLSDLPEVSVPSPQEAPAKAAEAVIGAARTTPAIAAAATAVPAAATPAIATPRAASVDADEYLVAVGIFADLGHADKLVDTLAQAGLPAMQRPFRFREKDVQQIALGPYFSRADATTDLQRLRELGGYADATVIVSASQQ